MQVHEGIHGDRPVAIPGMAVDRRGFLASAAAGIAATVHGETAAEKSSFVKFLAFADIHYCPGVFPHDSREWLERVLARAEANGVDFVIHAGDFAHNPAKERDYVSAYNEFKIPTYHTLGNHDTEECSFAETLAAYRKTHSCVHHVIAWEDPISAVVTLDTSGRLRIEGQRSRFFMGISPEIAKLPQRDRPITPCIQSVDITLSHLVRVAGSIA